MPHLRQAQAIVIKENPRTDLLLLAIYSKLLYIHPMTQLKPTDKTVVYFIILLVIAFIAIVLTATLLRSP